MGRDVDIEVRNLKKNSILIFVIKRMCGKAAVSEIETKLPGKEKRTAGKRKRRA